MQINLDLGAGSPKPFQHPPERPRGHELQVGMLTPKFGFGHSALLLDLLVNISDALATDPNAIGNPIKPGEFGFPLGISERERVGNMTKRTFKLSS